MIYSQVYDSMKNLCRLWVDDIGFHFIWFLLILFLNNNVVLMLILGKPLELTSIFDISLGIALRHFNRSLRTLSINKKWYYFFLVLVWKYLWCLWYDVVDHVRRQKKKISIKPQYFFYLIFKRKFDSKRKKS